MAKITFDSIAKDNESLAGEIHALVSRSPLPAQQQAKNDGEDNGETDEGEENLKSLLRRLYGSICEFRDFRGYAATSDKKIIATWKSFLMPIRALAQMRPDGQMIAARMILYLGAAFPAASQLPRHLPRSTTAQNQVDLRFGLLIALDDALLECLTALWDRSHHRASFRWVFTHHSVSKTLCHVKCQCQIVPEDVQEDEEAMEKWAELRNSERFNTACLTRLCQLIPAHGVRGGYLWHRADGDTTKRSRDPDATQWSYEGDGEERLLKWQYIGSDGPIREDYQYDIIKSDVKPTQYDSRSRQLLRRSRQFVLDARRIAAVNLFKDRRVAAQCALARHFPAELQEYVLGHLDAHKPQEHPYLSKIDLSIAYASFPDIGKAGCDQCSKKIHGGAHKMMRSTCPIKSITIWSMPLRAFHTLHRTGPQTWGLCKHEKCTGHHKDASWHMQDGLGKYLDGIVSHKCRLTLGLEDIGLGPLRGDRLESGNNHPKAWWTRYPVQWLDPMNDTREEADWLECKGLARVMRSPSNTSLTSLPSGRAPWMFGRTRGEEATAILAFSGVEI